MKEIAKHNDCTIFVVRQADKNAQFWQLLGPMATSPEVHKALAGPVTDTPDHTWLLAVEDGRLEAMSSYTLDEKGVAHFNETYVAPHRRKNGLYEKLFDLKYELCVADGATAVVGMANSKGRGMFDKRGWQETRSTKNWTWFRKEVV